MFVIKYMLAIFLIIFFSPTSGFAKGSLESAKSCGKCHEDIYSKWKNSLHAHSVDDPIFLSAYKDAYFISKGSAKFVCLVCHAPTVSLTKDFDMASEITREGITCDFCHTLKDVDLTKKNVFISDPGRIKRGPLKNRVDIKEHEGEFSSLHLSSKLCSACHEYSVNGVAVMETYSEWLKGPYSKDGTECQSCHMPLVEGIVSNTSTTQLKINEHNLQGGHYIDQLKRAVKVSIKNTLREGVRVKVTVEVENIGSGHMVPTGIPTRKLILSCIIKVSGQEEKRIERIYEKIIADGNGIELTKDSEIMLGYGRKIIKDNRILPKEKREEEFNFYIPKDKKIDVEARLVYSYVPQTVQPTEMKFEIGTAEKAF